MEENDIYSISAINNLIDKKYSFENLEKGLEKDKALQLAKLEFLKQNPLKSHPYYWSGFVLNGNNSALKTKSYYWFYIIGFGLFTLLILFRKKLIQLRQ